MEVAQEWGSDGRQAQEPHGGVQGPGGAGGAEGRPHRQRAGRALRRPPDADPRLEEATAAKLSLRANSFSRAGTAEAALGPSVCRWWNARAWPCGEPRVTSLTMLATKSSRLPSSSSCRG